MMILAPKRIKFSKHHSRNDVIRSKNSVQPSTLGYFSLISEDSAKINSKQLETIRLTLRRSLKKQSKLWIKAYLSTSSTKKPLETRLGRGKASPKVWNSVVRPGKVLVEIKNIDFAAAIRTLDKLKSKLSVRAFIKSKFSRWIL